MEREPDIDGAAEAHSAPTPAVDARELAAIFAGGLTGALMRAALEQALGAGSASWPWATFAVNILASGLVGYAVVRLGEHRERTIYARALLATGVCGALSTFSTVMLELIRLEEHAGLELACAYGVASILGGLAAVVLGVRLATGRNARP